MWYLNCPDCGHPVLIGPRGVREIVNLDRGGILLVLRCPFGHRIEVRTGRKPLHSG